jgi:hypothetical protein
MIGRQLIKMGNHYDTIEKDSFYKKYNFPQGIHEVPFWMTVLDDIYYRMFEKNTGKYNLNVSLWLATG